MPDQERIDERPRYLISQAARYVRISPTTLRSWVRGRDYPASDGPRHFAPLINPPAQNDQRLSFANLIEAHVLRSLRTKHEIPMQTIRTAIDYAERELKVTRLLLREDLKAGAGTLFIEHLGELMELRASGQMALKNLFDAYLQRIEWNTGSGFASDLFPLTTALRGPKIVRIDPTVAFGRPIISGKGVRTQTIVERLDAEETRETIAADYGLTDAEIDEAVFYERAA